VLRRRIEVAGIVQGVGFRPHVYRLATERGLAGTIRNTASGVTIEVQGPSAVVSEFVERLSAEAPPLARITGLQVLELPCNGEAGFQIVATDRTQAVRTLISPDVATCPDCLRELFDPPTAVTAIPSLTAPTAGRVSPSCAMSLTTVPTLRWPGSSSARPARPSTAIR
jgi:hydrogenase maturation protein HypF